MPLDATGVPDRVGARHAFVRERLLALVMLHAPQGGLSASKPEIARALGCSERMVDRALAELKREGLVKTIPQYASNGSQLANVYLPARPDEDEATAL